MIILVCLSEDDGSFTVSAFASSFVALLVPFQSPIRSCNNYVAFQLKVQQHVFRSKDTKELP